MLSSLIEVAVEALITRLRHNSEHSSKNESLESSKSSMRSTNSSYGSSDLSRSEEELSDIEKNYMQYFSNNWSDMLHRDDGWRTRSDIVTRDKQLMNHIYSADTTIVRCQPMFSRNKHNGFRFPKFDVPKEVTEAVYEDKHPVIAFPILEKKLDPKNYDFKFHHLLYYEEASMYLAMRNFDMDLQTLNKCGEYMALEVPRSVAKKNKLIGGNRVLLTHPTRVPKLTFEGYIHKIKDNFILMRFHDDFHQMYDGTAYNVSFHCSRTYFRQCHYAIDLIHRHVCYDVLFPKDKRLVKSKYLWKARPNSLHFFQSGLNSRQKNAVIGVLRSPQRPSPYLIVGPKRSGKTTVLIECVLHVVSKINRSRIIVCTNSNACADFIALKLLESNLIHEGKLTRLVSFNYSQYIDEKLKPVCVVFKDDPHDNNWLYRKVIVTTCNNAGSMYCMLKHSQHFTHCFIDDSAKTTEPEALVAIGLVAPGLGVTVLTGDPTQLKPLCESSVASEYGLSESMLVRLMQMDVYHTSKMYESYGDYNPFYITKLEYTYE